MATDIDRQLGIGQGSMARRLREFTLDPQPIEPAEEITYFGMTADEWLATPVVDVAWREAYSEAYGIPFDDI